MPDSTAQLAAAIKLHRAGKTAEAIDQARRVVQREPRNADALNTLGMILFEDGKNEQARYMLERAVALEPSRAQLHNNLSNIRLASRDIHGAIEGYKKALALQPGYYMPHVGISRAYILAERLDLATLHAQTAVGMRPDRVEPVNALAGAFLLSGRVDELLDTVRKLWGVGGGGTPGIAEPTPAQRVIIGKHILLPLNYSDKLTPEEVFEQHKAIGQLLQEMVPPDPRPLTNPPDPDRPLRVGYISQDFRNRSVAHFIEPILASHDRKNYKVHLYYNNHDHDEMTDRLRSLADGWLVVADMDDPTMAQRIKDDRIDVLIDLTGHTGGNRVQVLCYRCAPVQCTYLGYANTTGIPSVRHRFIDALTDPPGAERLATEELVRLPGCFLVYNPPAHAPDVSPPPCTLAPDAPVTFGSFNTHSKVSAGVYDAWAQILARVPGSRLLIKNLSLGDTSVRSRVLKEFESRGVDEARLDLRGETPGKAEHMGTYAQVDIALDTFPYNGTTTTMEALWMGVPVVTIAGNSHVSRVGVSLLTNAGLPELVAQDRSAYVDLAASLASRRDELARLRSELRPRLKSGPLCDAAGFTRRLEGVYRDLWRRWCDSVTEAL